MVVVAYWGDTFLTDFNFITIYKRCFFEKYQSHHPHNILPKYFAKIINSIWSIAQIQSKSMVKHAKSNKYSFWKKLTTMSYLVVFKNIHNLIVTYQY